MKVRSNSYKREAQKHEHKGKRQRNLRKKKNRKGMKQKRLLQDLRHGKKNIGKCGFYMVNHDT